MAVGSRRNFQSRTDQTSDHHQADEMRTIRDLDIKGFEQVTKGIRVLVVDDDATSVAIVAGILMKMKYQVMQTRSPIEALSMVRANPKVFDLILADVHMPEMSGLELVETCQKEKIDMPVVLMSGDTKGGIIVRGLRLGALHCLTKPIDVFSLHKIWMFVYRYSREKAMIAKAVAEAESEPAAGGAAKPRRFRLRWSDDLHNKFVQVVNEIGVDNARPSKIHEYLKPMIPNLTKQHISRHLQMYRKWLKNARHGESSASAAAASLPPTTTTRPINQHLPDPKNNDRQVTNNVGIRTGYNDPFHHRRAHFFPPVKLSPDEVAGILFCSPLEENKFPDKVSGVPVIPYSTTSPTVPNQPIAGTTQGVQRLIPLQSSSVEFAADRTDGFSQQKIPNYEMDKTNTTTNNSSSAGVVADNKGKGIISEADDDELEAYLSSLSSLFGADDDPMHGSSSSWLSALRFK